MDTLLKEQIEEIVKLHFDGYSFTEALELIKNVKEHKKELDLKEGN